MKNVNASQIKIQLTRFKHSRKIILCCTVIITFELCKNNPFLLKSELVSVYFKIITMSSFLSIILDLKIIVR